MAEETPLSSLSISRRAQGALAKVGIHTLEQAAEKSYEELRAIVGDDTIAKLRAAARGDTAPGTRAERDKMRREVYLNELAAQQPPEVALERAENAVKVYFGGDEDA